MTTTDFLSAIVARKKAEVAEAKKARPLRMIREETDISRKIRPFMRCLETPGPTGINIVAEIKRASPSKGAIRPDLDPSRCASAYEKGGAAAISVLTDGPGFQGAQADLVKARQSVSLPVLRKDFLISAYQIYESRALGADAVLLIVRILARKQLKNYLSLCRELGLDALVEVHSAKEIEIATRAGAKLIGINNRDLSSFQTSIETAMHLVSLLEDDQVAVAESGIRHREDIVALNRSGIFNFLIGESLVRSDHPEKLLAVLMGAK